MNVDRRPETCRARLCISRPAWRAVRTRALRTLAHISHNLHKYLTLVTPHHFGHRCLHRQASTRRVTLYTGTAPSITPSIDRLAIGTYGTRIPPHSIASHPQALAHPHHTRTGTASSTISSERHMCGRGYHHSTPSSRTPSSRTHPSALIHLEQPTSTALARRHVRHAATSTGPLAHHRTIACSQPPLSSDRSSPSIAVTSPRPPVPTSPRHPARPRARLGAVAAAPLVRASSSAATIATTPPRGYGRTSEV